jgi:transcriptional antiterminator RfaH
MNQWYCIYTKSCQEDNISRRLSEFQEIEVLNPKFKRRKHVRSRLVETTEVLFPCYIFSRFPLEQYFHMIRYTRGVRRFVGDREGIPYVVSDSIIEYLKSRMQEGLVHFEPPRLTPGEIVEFVEGPFRGIRGQVLNELKPNERVIVLLNTLTYQAKVEVGADYLAKVHLNQDHLRSGFTSSNIQ